MYACKNCGRNLRFDIEKQKLSCDACQSEFDPYEITKESDGIESETYDTQVFLCPQCGGEIRADINEATSYCLYCGASTVLSSRISKEKKPEYIIPFQISKEECNNLYAKKVKGKILAPNSVRKKVTADSFRGIYMPYWVYSMKHNQQFNLGVKHDRRSGDYIYREEFALKGTVKAEYEGISYDASSSFPDNMSQVIAPYNVKEIKEFTPSYLSGFYADVSDVDSEVYREQSSDIVLEHSLREINRSFSYKYFDDIDYWVDQKVLTPTEEKAHSAMFPVWFMSFRHKDRITYSVVNGQTGDVYANLPVSFPKYLLASLLLFIPLFFLLSRFTITPAWLALITGALALVEVLLFNRCYRKISRKENNMDDRGFCYHNGMPLTNAKSKKIKKKKIKEIDPGRTALAVFAIVMTCGFVFSVLESCLNYFGLLFIRANLYGMICPILAFIFFMKGQKKYNMSGKRGISPTIISVISALLSGFVMIFSPVEDMIYYVICFVAIIGVAASSLTLIGSHNMLATRPLPQFNRTGGDDDAV